MRRYFLPAIVLALGLLCGSSAFAGCAFTTVPWQYNVSGGTVSLSFVDDTLGDNGCNGNVNVGTVGGVAVIPDPCQAYTHQTQPFSVTGGSTTTVISGTSGQITYLCYIRLAEPITQPGVGVAFIEGTGGNCATPTGSTGPLGGGVTAATGILGPNTTGFAEGDGSTAIAWTAATGDDMCVGPFASTVIISGQAVYVKH